MSLHLRWQPAPFTAYTDHKHLRWQPAPFTAYTDDNVITSDKNRGKTSVTYSEHLQLIFTLK